jgi:hypothetical protein
MSDQGFPWGGLAILAVFAGVWWLMKTDHEYEVKVCQTEQGMYGHYTDQCRHLLAEDALSRQENAEWCATHQQHGNDLVYAWYCGKW